MKFQDTYIPEILNVMREMVAYYREPDLRIVWANTASGTSVGSSAEALVGRHCYEVWHGRPTPCERCPVRLAFETEQRQEMENTTPDGRVWLIRAYPLRDQDGVLTGVMEFGEDISRYRHIELEHLQIEERLKTALHEKTILLQEIHHRTRNNMQVILGLIDLQVMSPTGKSAADPLRALQHRIQAMSLVHEQLYQSDLSSVSLHQYTRNLMCALRMNNRVDPDRIAFELDFEPIAMNIDVAVPFGLLCNELIVNAIQHAFPQGRRGTIRVGVRQIEDADLEIRVQDDGIGLPEHFDVAVTPTIGLRLVQLILEHQLKGTLTFNRRMPGTEAICRFHPPYYRKRI